MKIAPDTARATAGGEPMPDTTTSVTGLADLESLIARVRNLPEFVNECAPEAARQVKLQLDLTIGAGTDPYGEAWEPKKKGYGPPLAHAAAHVHVAAIKTKILIRLTGIEKKHHLGWAKGGTKRAVILTPGRDLPAPIRDAITKTIVDHFTEYMTRA